MQKTILFLFLLSFSSFLVTAQAPSGYYDDAEGLAGENLKTALHNIINNHNVESYDDLWTDFQSTDKKPNGYVWDMYSDVPGGTPAYDYTFGTDQCGNYSGEGSCYNREHSFPKSWFNDASPMYTDLFHLYPTDGYVNGQRGNYPFGETSSASWTSTNGTQKGPCSYPGYTGTIFEPIDEYKGDFARTYFYMVTRYEGQVAGWESNNSNADAVLNGTSFPAFEEWTLNMFMEWHENDPVSQKELDRNDAVYAIQNNRNPFIDHPEYVNYIWGDPNQNTPPVISDISISPATPTESDAVNIQASITDATGSIASAELTWGLSSGQLNNTIIMSDNGSYYITNSSIPAQSTDTQVFYKISATDDSSATTTTSQKSYTVGESSVTLLDEDFTTCPAADWTNYSLSSIEDWHCSVSEYMEINAYDGDAACDDWLITPSLNLDEYQEEKLTFKTWTRYSDTYYPPLEVKYSANYTEGNDPGTATWNTLSCTLSAEGSQTWTPSGEIDLSQISGNNVHIAFHYTSSGSGGGTSSWWKVDDVIISATNTVNNYPVISDVSVTPTNPTELDTVLISATITDDDLISAAYVNWYTKENPTVQTSNMNSAGDNYFTEIPPQAANDSLYFTIKAEDSNAQITSYTHEGIYINDEPSVGIKNDQKELFSIYPNPAKNFFRIKTNDEYANELEIMIYTIAGQKIYTKEIAPENTVSLENVPRGTYIIRIKSKKHTTNRRLIIK